MEALAGESRGYGNGQENLPARVSRNRSRESLGDTGYTIKSKYHISLVPRGVRVIAVGVGIASSC